MAERKSRPTICDGEVIDFAERFEDTGPGIFGRNMEPRGPYYISASRNAVIVHDGEFTTAEQIEAFIAVLREATQEAARLSRSRELGRGNFEPHTESGGNG